MHVSDGRVHMTVALVYASSDTVVWGKSLDRDLSQVEALQHEVAKAIAKEICEREAIKAMIVGSIAKLGSHYVLTLEAINAH